MRKNAESRDDREKKNVDRHRRRQRMKITFFLSSRSAINDEVRSFCFFYLLYEMRLTSLIV
jgi:hypothetical protein